MGSYPETSIDPNGVRNTKKHPKFCVTIVYNFSWVQQPSQEKLMIILIQTFGRVGRGGGGVNKVYYGQLENSE